MIDAVEPPPTLQSRNLVMRRALHEDVQRRLAIGPLSPEILRLYGFAANGTEAFTEAHAEAWVRRLGAHPYAWIIQHNDALLGEVRLDNVDQQDRRASFAIGLLDSGTLGLGYGSEAALEVLRFAFGPLGLHRVSFRVLAFNERAIRLYRKLGFSVEGRERETVHVDGVWQDDLIMGLLEREFAAS